MNTNHLKKFAQEARRKLLEQVGAKLSFVLTTDSAEMREKTEQLKQLREELSRTTKEQLVEKVAYTWFNRLMALRFMDINDYQPLGIRIITPKDGYTIPELLDEAKRGNIPEELKINRQKIYDLLDNNIPSNNPQNEAFKELLISTCNHLNTTFPFLFERINDYTELLIPDDLTSDFSIIKDVSNGMLIDDCKNVEIIGWLYQYYISEENERLIKSKKVYNKHELAPASQLFTPKWIVQYMVDNTLGQILTEFFPSTSISNQLEFYIKPAYEEQLQTRPNKKIEEIKLFDPCVGSAHILAYAFDVFYLIYREQGYNESEIPELIISLNLFGTDIDERAAQLSSFVLMMKGRQYDKRFFNRNIYPNILFFQDFEFDEKFKNASIIGSLIKVEANEKRNITIDEGSIFSHKQKELVKLYSLLEKKYDVVVTNPPYISSSRMEGTLKQFIETNFQDTKYDLFATFIIRCLELCNDEGLTGFMSPFVWMFITSYEKLRKTLINKHLINNLIQLEYSGFDGATVPICTFTLRKQNIVNAKGSYIRLTNFKGAKLQAPKTLEAIINPNCGWFYIAQQKHFNKIPNSTIGYWLSDKIKNAFEKHTISDYATSKAGIVTGNDAALLKIWSEISFNKISFCQTDYQRDESLVYVPLNKGGGFKKYYGNYNYVLNIWDLWTSGKTTKAVRRGNPKWYFKEGITWTMVTSSKTSFRYSNNKVFNVAAPSIFIEDSELIYYILGYLNSKVVEVILPALNPTLNILTGDIMNLPLIFHEEIVNYISEKVKFAKKAIKNDWDSREESWDFQQNELIRIKGQNIEETYDLYEQYWKNIFNELHKSEEEINLKFIQVYGLEDEINGKIPLEDITILKDETSINNGQLVFVPELVFAQFISYAVGCMFGRFSLDNKGLILCNRGESINDYLIRVSKTTNNCSFLPDEDNIIPILDDEWFEDDIVGRFYQFLRITFGEKDFNKNLAFIEEQIGKDIRKYFMKGFYPDHIKRYKKRPIYWMFSSSKGSFNVLIYMHRYTPDTVSNILNKYLKEFIGKLNTRKENLQQVQVTGSASDKTKAIIEIDKIEKMLVELHDYERDILYPLATERIEIALDDGVMVNYNKFGKALKEVNGLNDPATKKKVKQFDWIDASQIR